MAARFPDLIRRARILVAERDRLVDSLVREWVEALRGQGLSARDLEELWAGLTEEAVRQFQRSRSRRWPSEAVRREAGMVIARVRERVNREIWVEPERF